MNLKIKKIDYHRNGICGNGFYSVLFDFNDDETNKKAIRHMVATLFLDKEMNIAVYDVDLLAQGINEFGLNSWRGDQFYYDIKKAIDEKEAKDEKEAREAREAINN